MDFDKQKDPFITFRLRILLKSGHNLAIRDASGSSDPYCKFKYKNQVIYKSNVIFKNLNPIWEEEFSFLIDDPTEMIQIEAYDHDRFMSDDFLGGLSLNLSYFTLSQEYDLKLDLEAGPSSNDIDEDLGYLAINLMIEPFTQNERDLFLSKSSRGVIAKNNLPTKSLKPAQIWYAVLNVVLAEAHLNCLSMSNESVKPSPYVKFRLGQEKYKSKVCQQTLAPQWLEQFDLHIFDEENHMLELCVLDKVSNVVLAKGSIKVSDIKKEETNENWLVLDDEKGSVLLLLSKSGSSVTEGSIQNKSEFEKEATMTKYSLFKSLENLSDVGHLTVKIFKAEGLAAADLNFKSDPYIVVELDNSRLQTHTEYKTLNPTFNKMFTFNVKDIHSILSFTVYDEDPNKKAEFLGKINIPLLSIKNGTKKWYGLKDIDLKNRAKGQIYIEMEVIWNPFRAAIRTFNPRERKLIAKKPTFQKQKLIRDINSLKAFYKTIAEYSDFVSSIFNWDNPIKSILSMVIFLISVYYIQMFHLPMILVFILLKNYMKLKVSRSNGFYVSLLNLSNYNLSATHQPLSQQDSIDDTDLTEDKQSKGNVVAAWRNVVFSLGDHLVLIQESIHYIVSLLERVINALNFSVPYISITAIAVLSLISLLLFLIPLRWIVMIWGINKFTKKLRNPHFIPNNEVLDFLSRVPSETEKVRFLLVV
uniref:Multiple C2 and transmembrane domain-containing protein 1 n=1 Tax=Rhabditophanes sp. KR3021 TaxID=114890 RepID=A0AC35TUN2_9BILA